MAPMNQCPVCKQLKPCDMYCSSCGARKTNEFIEQQTIITICDIIEWDILRREPITEGNATTRLNLLVAELAERLK